MPLSFWTPARLIADVSLSTDASADISTKSFRGVGRDSCANGASFGEPPEVSSGMDTYSCTSSADTVVEAMDDQFEIPRFRLNSTDTEFQHSNGNDMLAYIGGADEIAEHFLGSMEEGYDQINATIPKFLDNEDHSSPYVTTPGWVLQEAGINGYPGESWCWDD